MAAHSHGGGSAPRGRRRRHDLEDRPVRARQRRIAVVDVALPNASDDGGDTSVGSDGTGPHGVAAQIEFCRPLIAAGAVLLGVVVDEQPPASPCGAEVRTGTGAAGVAPRYVAHRRRGVAQALWTAATELARLAEARAIYVSATPPALPSASTSGRGVGWLIQHTRLSSPTSPTTSISLPVGVAVGTGRPVGAAVGSRRARGARKDR